MALPNCCLNWAFSFCSAVAPGSFTWPCEKAMPIKLAPMRKLSPCSRMIVARSSRPLAAPAGSCFNSAHVAAPAAGASYGVFCAPTTTMSLGSNAKLVRLVLDFTFSFVAPGIFMATNERMSGPPIASWFGSFSSSTGITTQNSTG